MSAGRDLTPVRPGFDWVSVPTVTFREPGPIDVSKWPCELCGHGHYPGERCGANGCECRA